MTSATTLHVIGTALFAAAVLHTFSTKFFEHLAHQSHHHARFWHLLGEVEIVFGLWAMVLICFMAALYDQAYAITYLEQQDFTEPLFVFVIMVISASKPILDLCSISVARLSGLFPTHRSVIHYFVVLSVVPLLGSFITEPAAMTLAALLLKRDFYDHKISTRMMYATISVLFVNISIGGTPTPYAAPPILMVAGQWNWDMSFMLSTFGWRSALAVMINAFTVSVIFAKELQAIKRTGAQDEQMDIPLFVTLIHLCFLWAVVYFSHHSVIFMGLLLLFIGFAEAYDHYQNKLMIRESLLVAFFLAGLVVLGGQQRWWLQPLLTRLDPDLVYYGATALTAITDNAALTYLGSLVEGLSADFKYALVAGAVTGGGLTVIANAPNPAGYSIIKANFDEGAISPMHLFLYAIPPTFVAIVFFKWV